MPTEPKTPSPRPTTPIPLDDATRDLIRGKARQLVSRCGFSVTDLADIEQDIAAHVMPRLGRYNPAKADSARFVRLLLAHAVATVLRDRRRRKRRASPSLSAVLRKQPATEPVDPMVQTTEQIDLALDVAAVLATLSPRLRRVAETLKAQRPAVAARHLKLSRSAVYRMLAELRTVFVGAGLADVPSASRSARVRKR